MTKTCAADTEISTTARRIHQPVPSSRAKAAACAREGKRRGRGEKFTPERIFDHVYAISFGIEGRNLSNIYVYIHTYMHIRKKKETR